MQYQQGGYQQGPPQQTTIVKEKKGGCLTAWYDCTRTWSLISSGHLECPMVLAKLTSTAIIVSPLSAVASLPKKDVNVAPTAASAAPTAYKFIEIGRLVQPFGVVMGYPKKEHNREPVEFL